MPILHLEPSLVSRTYGVQFVFDAALRIHFEIVLHSVKTAANGHWLFTLDKQQVYINDKAPELIADKLAEDLGKIIYPLVLQADEEGYLHAVANADAIKERWEKERPLIERYYEGRIVREALAQMELMVSDPVRLGAAIRNDWFIALFFSGIYGLKPFDFRQKTDFLLPMIAYGPMVKYRITREITEQHTESKCLIIACKGMLEEARSLEDILQKSPVPVHQVLYGNASPAEGTVVLSYRLYHSDFSVRAITGRCSMKMQENQERNVTFEIYHLREKDLPGTAPQAAAAAEGPDGAEA